jgi:hypothetical protein
MYHFCLCSSIMRSGTLCVCIGDSRFLCFKDYNIIFSGVCTYVACVLFLWNVFLSDDIVQFYVNCVCILLICMQCMEPCTWPVHVQLACMAGAHQQVHVLISEYIQLVHDRGIHVHACPHFPDTHAAIICRIFLNVQACML